MSEKENKSKTEKKEAELEAMRFSDECDEVLKLAGVS